ncbi:hypothetical protein AK830_g11986 [Neonectria ditissima]|uniref:Uncharacterized protein n=1 Tax=Neonectria ditissima TaxID=78410 RepID=A0A0P7ABM9_9HYPO|nr:hypothetical protein AK830_g11986 [Neonectria ditissima]
MNWTEGALARHSRRKGWDKDAARQKQYFARARARKSEAASKRSLHASSFIPDYIPQSPQAQDRHQPSLSPRHKQSKRSEPLVGQSYDKENTTATVFSQHDGPDPRIQNGDSHSTSKSSSEGNSGANLDAKRRRLLEKNDWTGVSLQNPILVSLSGQGGDARKPVPSDADSRPTKRQKISEVPRKGNSARGDKSLLGNDGQMNIRIGSQNLRWSRDNNTVRSSTSQNRPLPTFEAWASQQGSSRSTRTRPHSTPSDCLASELSLGTQGLSETDSSEFEHQDRPTSSANGIEHSLLEHVDKRREKNPDQPRYVVTSSPPIIYHPQPTRGRRLALFDIRSPTPEDIGSVVAQIGAPNHSSDRITDDDAQWNSWLNAKDCTRSRSHTNDTQEYGQPLPSISPGISHYRDGSDDWSLLPGVPETADGRDLPSDSNELPPICPSILTSPNRVSTSSVRHEAQPPVMLKQRTLGLDERLSITPPTTQHIKFNHMGGEEYTKAGDALLLPSTGELPKAPNVQDLIDLLIIEEGKGQPEDNDDQRKNAEDEDESWRRFVFDEDSTEINRRARFEAQQQTVDDLYRATTGLASDVAEPPSISRDNPSMSPASIASLAMYSQEISSCTNNDGSSDVCPTNTTGTANSNTAHIGSPRPQHSDFKFHQPNAFVGRLARLAPTNTRPIQLPLSKRGRGRPKKCRGSGRPDFRTMPDHDDDPIEECCEG